MPPFPSSSTTPLAIMAASRCSTLSWVGRGRSQKGPGLSSVVQTGSQWVLDAKVDVAALTDIVTETFGTQKSSESEGVTRADLAQIGVAVSVSFRLPGRIVSANATSVSGSVTTWNLLSPGSTDPIWEIAQELPKVGTRLVMTS